MYHSLLINRIRGLLSIRKIVCTRSCCCCRRCNGLFRWQQRKMHPNALRFKLTLASHCFVAMIHISFNSSDFIIIINFSVSLIFLQRTSSICLNRRRRRRRLLLLHLRGNIAIYSVVVVGIGRTVMRYYRH